MKSNFEERTRKGERENRNFSLWLIRQ